MMESFERWVDGELVGWSHPEGNGQQLSVQTEVRSPPGVCTGTSTIELMAQTAGSSAASAQQMIPSAVVLLTLLKDEVPSRGTCASSRSRTVGIS